MRTYFPTQRRGDIILFDFSASARKIQDLIQDSLDKGMREEQIDKLIEPLLTKLTKQLELDKSVIRGCEHETEGNQR